MKVLAKIVKKAALLFLITFTLVSWPVNLYLKNTPPDYLSYTIPAVLLALSLFLRYKKSIFWSTPMVLIGLYEVKLVLIPVIFLFLEILINFKKITLSLFIVGIAIFLPQANQFKGQSVFNRDYEGEQEILRNIYLYPNPTLARMFQNKPKIYLEKIYYNFFTLVDPGNYFFAGHPAPTSIPNQELYKFLWPTIPFLLIGVHKFKDLRENKTILIVIISSLLNLSLLTNFDRHDFILWVPVSLIIIHGIKKVFD